MKVIFDVGACDGDSGINLCNTDDCLLFAFEADPKWIDVIQEKFQHNPNFTLVPKAVSDKNGTAQFNFSMWGGASSLCSFKDNGELEKKWRNRPDIHYSGNSIAVETVRLDSFIEKNSIDKIDYLHIDTQGNDFAVLQSLGKYVDIVLEGDCEVARSKESAIYKDQNSFLDNVVRWLVEHNFEIEAITENDSDGNELVIKFKRKLQ
jgi:FkbM family methyltransferase